MRVFGYWYVALFSYNIFSESFGCIIGETNKHRYVLVTQSQSLRFKMRSIPAVPIVHINRSVMILEPPSDATIRAKNAVCFCYYLILQKQSHDPSMKTEQKSLEPSALELAHLTSTSQGEEAPPKKKRKGPKGPNPLSVKKKQKTTSSSHSKPQKRSDPEQTSQTVGVKRKRSDDVGSNAHDLQVSTTSTGGHKRRKRRKHTGALAAPSDVAVEG